MANIDRSHSVDGGLILDDGAGLFQDNFDPTVASGLGAAIGSIYMRNTDGQAYRKIGGADTDWVKIDSPRLVSFVIENPTAADQGLLQHKFAANVTILRVSASTDQGTATLQFDERVENAPNTGGTDVLTSALVADTDSQVTTSFANAGIAANAVLNLDIDAVSGTPGVVRIHVEFIFA